MADPSTPTFLRWVADRMHHVYGESLSVDFVTRLRHEAAKAETLFGNLTKNEETYQLFDTGEVSRDGRHHYLLARRGKVGKIGSKLILNQQQADDLSRQLDAPIDYIND